jgi:hypothetical protein
MNEDTREALKRAQFELMAATAKGFVDVQDLPTAIALESVTGVAAIDDLLEHVDASSGTIQARWGFFDRILKAAAEPLSDDNRKGRSKRAEEAAVHIRQAAALLSELDNAPMSEMLVQLAKIIQARAHTSQISAKLNTEEIVPGTRVLVRYQSRYMSTIHAGTRGKSSQRAEIIRFIATSLTESTPPTKIADLLSKVFGIDCQHDNVIQALPQKSKSDDVAGADLQSAMGWGKRPG